MQYDIIIASAAGEKLVAWATEDHLTARASRGNRAKFEVALSHIPDVEPTPQDQ